ncbi:MAG: carbohydrate kinase family protein [Clostridiaceae bacterium]|nr:carbohydrate kinase family protein [Clostridiaceae bacterium]
MKKGITVAGNLLVDHNREVDFYPEHSSLVKINKSYNTLGGAVCNSGIALAKLDQDLQVNALGIIGDDADGHEILTTMQKYPNLDCSQIIFGQSDTSYTDVILDMTNNTRTFFSYAGTNAELGPEHFDFDAIDSDILHIGYILLLDRLDVSDSQYGTKMARVLYEAQMAGLRTSIDVVTEQSDRFSTIVPPAIKYTNFCIINEEEAARTVKRSVRDISGNLKVEECKKVCEELFELGVQDWVIIHAREGGIGLDNNGNFFAEASLNIPPEDIKGTTGAGDAFLAGALYGAWKGYDIEKSLKLAIGTSNASLIESGPTEGIKSEKEIWKFYNSMEKEQWEGFN